MIPIKLELKNFLSYGSEIQVVDFKDHSLICLSGRNGNGKSALLDAMTWVIWGQARKVSGTIKPDDGLLRLGQTRMMVSLEFHFSGTIYRVRREYAKTYGKPFMALDFDIYDTTKEKFFTLTEKTIKSTQTKIEKLIGLDYLTFTNTAYLRQGQADEFSKKTPKERKQILSNILNLSRYDELQSLSLQRSRNLTDEKRLSLKLQESDQKEIDKEKDLKILLKDEKEKITAIKKNISNVEKEKKTINDELSLFLKGKDKFLFYSKELSDIINRYSERLGQFNKLRYAWKKDHSSLLKIDSVKNLDANRKALELKEKSFVLIQKNKLNLQQELLKTQEKYQLLFTNKKQLKDQKLSNLRIHVQKKEIEVTQSLNLQKNKKLDIENLLEQQKKIDDKVVKLKTVLNEANKHYSFFEKQRSIFDKRRSFYQVLIQRGNWLKTSLSDLQDKIETIKNQESPSCPLCEQVLTLKRKSFLSNKFYNDFQVLQYRLLRPTNLIKRLKDILLEQHNLIREMEKKDIFYKEQKAKLNEIEKSQKELSLKIKIENKLLLDLNKQQRALEKDFILEKKQLDEAEKQVAKSLTEDEFLKPLFEKIQNYKQEYDKLKYDEIEHVKLQNTILDLDNKIKFISTFEAKKNAQEKMRLEMSALFIQLKELKKQKINIEKKIKELNFIKNLEAELTEKTLKLNDQYKKELLLKDQKLQQIARFEYELKKIADFKMKFKTREKEVNVLNDQISEYQILSQAFSKNGIQALLIEQSIPQIEEEANNILSKLTNNQSQIFIESLRDLKGGGVRETLDIKISDAVGIRPYEMFSGGEAFRVDFALRIAISKLLARRAGVALQTLIIDEGFGSQDEDGLSLLMDAIYAIKADFSKVIVVSHLESFKENFPVHFVVQKTASGSFVSVHERG